MRRSGIRSEPTDTRMIRFLLRFIGLCLLATAFVFFVYDGTESIANQHMLYMKVGDAWAMVDQNSLNGAEVYVMHADGSSPVTAICGMKSTSSPSSGM